MWIDTHCHLDAAEFDADRDAVREAARLAGVARCVIPAVQRAHWADVAQLAERHGDAYALGIHPLYVPQAQEADLLALDQALRERAGDPRLVAVGEIGLDFFVPALCTPEMRERQWFFYTAQLQLAPPSVERNRPRFSTPSHTRLGSPGSTSSARSRGQ